VSVEPQRDDPTETEALSTPVVIEVDTIRDAGRSETPDTDSTPPEARPDASPDPYADSVMQSYDAHMAKLRKRGLGAAAKVLVSRVAQEEHKYKLSEEQATEIARYFLSDLAEMPASRKLLDVMPRTTVELVRATRERGVAQSEAEEIADYLFLVTKSMRFGNLRGVDVSHSHVVGREWWQIDYSGEPMTWEEQQRDWEPLGVVNFKKASYIRAYFKHVSKMRFFKRVYRPTGRLPTD